MDILESKHQAKYKLFFLLCLRQYALNVNVFKIIKNNFTKFDQYNISHEMPN